MQMAEQLHQLVTASQIHQKTSEIALAPVRLSSLLSTIDKDTNKFASEQGVQLRVVPTRAVVASDPVLLGSVIGNLTRNAVKFTGAGGKVCSDAGVSGRSFASRFTTRVLAFLPNVSGISSRRFIALSRSVGRARAGTVRCKTCGGASSAPNRSALDCWPGLLLYGLGECIRLRLAASRRRPRVNPEQAFPLRS